MVNAARDHGLRLSVKGGGHAYAAHTVGEGGFLIDLSPMKMVEVDPEAKTARVGPGARWPWTMDPRDEAVGQTLGQ